MKTETLFSSANCEWETPPELFKELDERFHFTLDVASTDQNALCERHYTKEQNGLIHGWQTGGGSVWCNPPYGKDIKAWVRKAWEESQTGQVIVMLIPARTDTAWFHDYIYHKANVVFLRGRLHYGLNGVRAVNNAAFPSMLAIYNGENDYARSIISIDNRCCNSVRVRRSGDSK